jgi:hypothetical protein
VWLALEIVVPVLIGVGGFHALMRLRLPRDEARRATMRFAALWVPAAVVIVIAATVVYGN